jgi:hypothetical protein
MIRLKLVVSPILLALALAPSVASAKNFCVTGFSNSGFVLVGKAFTVPPKGACKAWLGFNPILGKNNPVTGIGCTSSDGSNLSLNLTTAESGLVEINNISLSLPSLTGTFGGQILSGGGVNSVSGSGLTGGTCTNNTIPASEEEGEAGGGASEPLSR